MSTITHEQQQSIRDYVNNHVLPRGLGSAQSACSIASINLALTGRLTDEIPDCMSLVIGRWIILVQDSMPDQMRNSVKWKSLLPLAAGTGRNVTYEKHRLNIILKWMWCTVLPRLQTFADQRGYGDEWRRMTDEKTKAAAYAAADAAYAASSADAADAAAYAAAASYAARSAAAAYAAAQAARSAASYAARSAAAYDAAYDAEWDAFWNGVDPCGVLEQLVNF